MKKPKFYPFSLLTIAILPIFTSLNAEATLDFYPQNASQPQPATPNTKAVANGSDYYTIPSKSADAAVENNLTHDPQGNQVYNPNDPNNELYQIPDRAIPSNPKTPVTVTKTPANTQSSTSPVTPATNATTKTTALKPATVKEKIVPTVKKVNLKFSDFPAKIYTGKRVAPNLANLKGLNSFYGDALGNKGVKGEKQFIQTLSKAKPNFAGHYVINSFTCGLNCTASVAYDVKTGNFMELGGGFADCPATDFNPRQKANITHQANSRLLIVIGATTSGNCIAGYFEEKNGNVSLISQKNLMTYVP